MERFFKILFIVFLSIVCAIASFTIGAIIFVSFCLLIDFMLKSFVGIFLAAFIPLFILCIIFCCFYNYFEERLKC